MNDNSMLKMNVLHFSISRIVLLFFFSLSAFAGPTDSVTVSQPPEGEGEEAFVPGTRLVADLRKPYVEEEYIISGQATLFSYADNPPAGPGDITAIEENMPYATRIIVRRPKRAKRFNGTVVIEWWNSTATFDTAPAWDTSAEYFARKGVVYVGVTNSATSISHLVGGCSTFGAPPTCGTRYAELSIPENGLAYEMMSQIATLLKTGGSNSPLPASFQVRNLIHVGESQQAGSLVTYASAFHLDGVNDGYFVQAGINARPINFGPTCDEEDSQPFPECTPRLQYPDSLVRNDLPVPVYQVVTQTDFEVLGFNVNGRQPDTDTYRYYEVAGGGHVTTHKNIELFPAGSLSEDAIGLEDLCGAEMNTIADGPVFSGYVITALWKRMQEQIEQGSVPPAGILMEDIDGVLVRDALGNVQGGVRLPSMEALVATYLSTNLADPDLPPNLVGIGNLACRLSGAVSPFDQTTLDDLYPNHGVYVKQVS